MMSPTTSSASAARIAVMTTVSVEYPASGSSRRSWMLARILIQRINSRVVIPGVPSGGASQLKAAHDLVDGRVADEDQEAEEQQHPRQAHPFGGSVGLCFGVGQQMDAQRLGLRREAGPHTGAFGTGERDRCRQLAEVGDIEFDAELAQRGPRGC